MRTLPLLLCLLSWSLLASERDDLALALHQLSLLDATLQRARLGAHADAGQRYYFDYPRIHHDISLMRAGIERYLTPARAQPRPVVPLSGQYQREAQQP